LGIAYHEVALYYLEVCEDLEETRKWLQVMRQQAEAHHDAPAMITADRHLATCLTFEDDFRGAMVIYQQCCERAVSIGSARALAWILRLTVWFALHLGDLDASGDFGRRAREIFERMGHEHYLANLYMPLAIGAVCRGRWQEAQEAIQVADQLGQGI